MQIQEAEKHTDLDPEHSVLMMTPFPLFSGDNFATPKSAVRVKETKKRIAFSDVNIFYFNRVQGFSSVPR